LIVVNIYQIQDAISVQHDTEIEHFNNLIFQISVKYQYIVKLIFTILMIVIIADLFDTSTKIEVVLPIRRYGMRWFLQRHLTLTSWHYTSEGKYTKYVIVTGFAMVCILIFIGILL